MASWLDYYGITDVSNVLGGVDRGDGCKGTYVCTNPVGTPAPMPVGPCSWLDYHGATGIENVLAGVDRGCGQLGTLVCTLVNVGEDPGLNSGTGETTDATNDPNPEDICLIEALVHEAIGASPRLLSRIPIERWVTGAGRFEDGDGPYCSINIEGGSPDIRMNTGRIDSETVRFQIFADDNNFGRITQEVLINVLDDLSYNFQRGNGTKQTLYARVQNKFGIQEPSGVWQFLTDVIFWS